MTRRSLTPTWYPEPTPTQPVPQVQDPAVRDILLTRRRALLMEAAAIARRCGLDPEKSDDEAAESRGTLNGIGTLGATGSAALVESSAHLRPVAAQRPPGPAGGLLRGW